MALGLHDVRSVAGSFGFKEIQYDPNVRVIAFEQRNSVSDNNVNVSDRIRINVWYTTGTVGTYLYHPRQGRTQLFRRGVTHALLRDIFKKPRIHTELGYHFRSELNSPNKQGVDTRSSSKSTATPTGSPWGSDSSGRRSARERSPRGGKYDVDDSSDLSEGPVDEEGAAKAQMSKLLTEKEALVKEIAVVQGILDGFEKKREEERRRKAEEERRKREEEERKKKEKQERIIAELQRQETLRKQQEEWQRQETERQSRIAEENRKEYERTQRGTSAAWGGLHESDYIKNNFKRTTKCVAIGGSTTYLLDENGSSMFTTGLTKNVCNKLHNRPKHHPPPTYVALGSQNRYYIAFANGKSEWVGPDPLNLVLKENTRKVRSVAFGESWGSYFVVYEDGWWAYASVPDGLDKLIKSRAKRPDLDHVHLGPNSEWFLKAKNGKTWWGTWCNDVAKGKDVKTILFGDDRSYFIRHE